MFSSCPGDVEEAGELLAASSRTKNESDIHQTMEDQSRKSLPLRFRSTSQGLRFLPFLPIDGPVERKIMKNRTRSPSQQALTANRYS